MDKGARFFNCDFQVHTPRDTQFSGAEYISEGERKVYSENFIKACRDKKIDAVAITDHHDLSFYNFIKDASVNELNAEGNPVLPSNRIVIFPGLELTLSLPCQAIIIFDSNLNLTQELITSIYAKLNITDQSPANTSKISNVSRLPFNEINDVYESLEEMPQLKNRFIIFPNIKDGGGDSILRDGFHTKYANARFVGGYLDRGLYETHKTKQGWLNVINGNIDVYGKRKIGVFQTSDCRTETFEHLGISSTWVKWSEPTAEGLRQACLANESRISQEKPVLPSIFIEKLSIRNTTFLKTVEITFNEQFNILIGGRGTGKSSVLMYLEWVLGKDFDKAKAELLNDFIESTLDEINGVIEVSIIKNGVKHLIKRSKNDYKVKIGANEFQDTDSDNIQDIIKCKSFSQKELSKHNKNREKQLLEILKYSIKDNIEQSNRKLHDNALLIKESINNYTTYLDKVRKKNNLSNQIVSLTAEITELNNTLENLSEDDTKIIGAKSKYNYEGELIEKYRSIYEDVSESLKEMKEKNYHIHDLSEINGKIENDIEFSTLTNSLTDLVTKFHSQIDETIKLLETNEFNTILATILAKHSAYEQLYNSVKERLETHKNTIENIQRKEQLKKELKKETETLQQQIDISKGIEKKIFRYFQIRYELLQQICHLLQAEASRLSSRQEGFIEITMQEFNNVDNVKEFIDNNVSYARGQKERTSIFLTNLINSDRNVYKSLLKFGYALFRKTIDSSEDVDVILNDYGVDVSPMTNPDLERILTSIDLDKSIELLLLLPESDLVVKYFKTNTVSIPFEDASYGQQAGAILNILFNQEEGPLLIDQPEDDLDNKVIHKITEMIIEAKKHRQLIFSSHNANIAVNGDSEQIICFDHNPDRSAGEIQNNGAIDNENVKKLIKDVMEGGEKAFNLRKSKYGF